MVTKTGWTPLSLRNRWLLVTSAKSAQWNARVFDGFIHCIGAHILKVNRQSSRETCISLYKTLICWNRYFNWLSMFHLTYLRYVTYVPTDKISFMN